MNYVFPLDRTPVVERIHASELFTPLEGGMSTEARLDPYHDNVWSSGSSASWTSYRSLSESTDAGIARIPAAYQISEKKAWETLRNHRHFGEVLRLLAVISSWRTVTGEQAEALSNCRGASNPQSALISALFRLGIIDVGVAVTQAFSTAEGRSRGNLYRIGDEAAARPLLDELTYAEWVALTGGQGWSKGGQFDRHNILSTEVGVRAAEYLDLGGVLGEKFATTDLLAGTGIGYPEITDRRSADLCIVRPDGMRIAVEVTSTTNAFFMRKIERWAELIEDRPFNDSGFMVLFLIAAPKTRADQVRAEVYKKMASVLRRFPGTAQESVAARFAVATWTEFFPARNAISPRFLDLVVDRPTGDLFAGDQSTWQEVSLLDIDAIPYEPRNFDLNAILENIHLLWQSPVWTRIPEVAPDLTPTMMALSGETTIPVPAFKKSDRVFEHKVMTSPPEPMRAYM